MQNQANQQGLVIDSIDLNKLKEYFQSKGGRSKYSDLFNTFRDFIGNDTNAGFCYFSLNLLQLT
jgi:hypothetical protein